jgi:hypothetical protein
MNTPHRLGGLIGFALFCFLASDLYGRTWEIKPDGSGDAPTVQAGIDSSAAGDTVLVACGTYFEHDIEMKSGVCLKGEGSFPPCATIDAQQIGSLILCNSTSSSTIIEGLMLVNGTPPALNSTGPGAGPTVQDCVFANNAAPAVAVLFDSPVFRNCLFYGTYGASATITIAYVPARPLISNCTLVNNFAGVAATSSGSADVENCIIAYNDEFALWNDDSSLIMATCCDLFGNSLGELCLGPGCFSAEPQFCGVLGSNNYYLQSDSPCVPGNHPDGYGCGLIGALPVGCGSVEIQTRTWGAIKSLYTDE